MTIVELESFDLTVTPPSRLLSSGGFWNALPRIAPDRPVAKIMLIANTLSVDDIKEGFAKEAVPPQYMPAGVLAYNMQYEDFLNKAVQEVRYLRIFLSIASNLDEDGLLRLLGVYGMAARPIRDPIPRAFRQGVSKWGHIQSDDGRYWGMLQSKPTQVGFIHPRVFHSLFSQDFSVWAALNIYTYPQQEAVKLLRQKSATARYDPGKSIEAIQAASEVEGGVARLRYEMTRSGASIHTVNFYAMVGGDTLPELKNRLEVARGSIHLDMSITNTPGKLASSVFGADPITQNADEGSVLSTYGAALLAGSVLSYRRRAETRGVFFGTDKNQAPVIFNYFDDRNPSYNSVILGQTGGGKTFAALLSMMRHLLLGCRLIMIDPQGNIDLSFLGDDVYHRSVIGTGSAAINILDIVHNEIGNQVEGVVSMFTMLNIMPSGDPVARALVDEVLMEIYTPLWPYRNQRKIVPTLNAVQDLLRLKANKASLDRVKQAANVMAYNLNPFIRGSRAGLFGKQTTVDFSLSKAVNVFDVSQLPDAKQEANLRTALLSILVADINTSIRNNRRNGDVVPNLFFVDEMGILMRDPVMASYISSEYKTARARRTGMLVADQDLHSLLGPKDRQGIHHGIPILANAANRMIFVQSDDQKGIVKQHFPSLPSSLIEALPNLRTGTCVLILPNDVLMVNVIPSRFDNVVLSSRLEDRAYARQIIQDMVSETSGVDSDEFVAAAESTTNNIESKVAV